MAACNQADQDRAQQKTDNLAQQAQQAGHEIGDSLQQLGDQARQTVEKAAEDIRSNSQDAREAAARNAISAVAESEFRRVGIELTGTPTCNATSPAVGQYHVECTGEAADGKPVTLVGDDPGDAPSTFVGTHDGQEVFRQPCVGLC